MLLNWILFLLTNSDFLFLFYNNSLLLMLLYDVLYSLHYILNWFVDYSICLWYIYFRLFKNLLFYLWFCFNNLCSLLFILFIKWLNNFYFLLTWNLVFSCWYGFSTEKILVIYNMCNTLLVSLYGLGVFKFCKLHRLVKKHKKL